MLLQAGHTIIAKSLLTEDWSANSMQLRDFFCDKPVSEWFNRNAPAIKEGVIDPDNMNADQAICLMQADPLLIRRPLMQIGTEKIAGFDHHVIAQWLGHLNNVGHDDFETCSNTSQQAVNDHV